MVDGNEKGNRYMAEVCRLLSHWLVGTPRTAKAADLVVRIRSTALMPTVGHWDGKGDLLCRPDVLFPFCVECKKHEGVHLDGLFDAPKWPIWAWWDQALEQAEANRETPALIFCRNRRENRVLLRERDAQCLDLQPLHGPIVTLARRGRDTLVLCLLRDLTAIPPKRLERLDSVRSSRGGTSSAASRKRTGSPGSRRTRSGSGCST